MAKAKLLKAAREEFAASGLAGARVEDIARRAALAKGSFYLHFKSKEEAFLHVVNQFFADLASLVGECQVHVDKIKSVAEFREKLAAADERILDFCWTNRDVIRVIHESGHGEYEYLLNGFLDTLFAMIECNVEQLQDRGLYRKDVDPKVAAWAIAGAYNNLVRQMTKLKARPDIASWVASMTHFCTAGLEKR